MEGTEAANVPTFLNDPNEWQSCIGRAQWIPQAYWSRAAVDKWIGQGTARVLPGGSALTLCSTMQRPP